MIDWFTVIAQVVNFLILIGLLKYFLYGRIMDAIENREQQIASQHEQAELNLQESQSELELAKEENRRLALQREQSLAGIRTEVDVFRKQQMEKVRDDIEGVQTRWSKSIREEQDAFLHELSKRASESVCVIARRALGDLANVSLERRIVSRFQESLASLGETERSALLDSLSSVNQAAVIQTTHDLPDNLQTSLVACLENELEVKLDVRFETLPDLECGIAMQTNSHKLGWNLRDYLTELEDDLRKMIEEEASRTEFHSGQLSEKV